ncbi:MAG: hypothetical protein RMJ43_14195 [Chloroherpetonaceae bacterium]|nr:hypothetical protein [Chthonomonadaceae bacterium]MDW8208981.1 hypothetical protein [Chloroherpetonaceae bacterium]
MRSVTSRCVGILCSVAMWLPSCCSVTRAQEPYHLGISISANAYNERAWADMFKCDARIWQVGTLSDGPVDANGMPTTDCDIFVFDGYFAQNHLRMGSIRGTYRLYFSGQATVSAPWTGGIQNVQYDPATNTTTARLVINSDLPSILIRLQNTRRTPSSPLNSGVTNLKLMRPIAIGSTQSYPPNAVFTTEYLAAHNRGQVLRSMDFVATNFNIQRHWSDRRRVEELTYYGAARDPGYGWQGKGAPWELFILLCNLLDKDAWVNIPIFATDDYVRQLARLLRDTLEPERKIYVEYSNEVWNFAFAQWGHAVQLATEDLRTNPATSINFDGACIQPDQSVDTGIAVPRFWARRIMQISDIFREEFGPEAMMTRVRPLFETQAEWQHWIYTGLMFLDRYYNNADGNHVPNPRPVRDYLWGAGGSAYVHGYPDSIKNDPNATVDSILNGYALAWPEHYQTMARDTYWCSMFGLKRVAYESGTGLDDFAGLDSAIQAAQRDPRMKQIYKRCVDEFFKAGGELFVHFLGVNGAHGLLPFDAVVGTQPRPKQEAFDELLAAPVRPEPTVGFALPATIMAGRFHINHDGWATGNNDNPITLGAGYRWYGYTVRATEPGDYEIALRLASSAPGVCRILIDGLPAGTVAYPNTGNAQTILPPIPVYLSRGVHGLRVERVSGGSAVLSQILVTTGIPNRVLSGRLYLEGRVPAAGLTVPFEFRPEDGSPGFTRNVSVQSNGDFQVNGLPKRSYTVHIKGSKWLARNVRTDLRGGDANGLQIALPAGDASGDNAVDVLDLDLLIGAFDTVPGDARWNGGRADLNDDGVVDVLDLDLLIRNFDTQGDP